MVGLAEPMTIIVVVDIEGIGKLSLELNAFVDDSFQQQALASLEKEDDLFVQIKTHADNDVSRKVYAEDCYVTQNQNINPTIDDTAVMIIDNGCPIHNQTEILVNNIGHNVRFQSKIFEIADGFSQAWIICQVRFCDENDENCKVNDCDSVRKMHESSSSSSRKKRSLNTQLSRSKRATHASHMKGGIDDIYEVRIGPYFQKEYLSGDISGSSFNQNIKKGGLVPLVWVGIGVGVLLVVSVVGLIVTKKLNIYTPERYNTESHFKKPRVQMSDFRSLEPSETTSQNSEPSHRSLPIYRKLKKRVNLLLFLQK